MGQKCGCTKRFSLRGVNFYKDKPTVLYYIKIDDLYKVGVTLFKEDVISSLKKRFGKDFYKISILKADVFEDCAEAFKIEQEILSNNRRYIYYGENILPSGNTELFTKNIMGL